MRPECQSEKGRFVGYSLKRSSKQDVDRLFSNLLGGRPADTGHEEVLFGAADVPDFNAKKCLAAKLDGLYK